MTSLRLTRTKVLITLLVLTTLTTTVDAQTIQITKAEGVVKQIKVEGTFDGLSNPTNFRLETRIAY